MTASHVCMRQYNSMTMFNEALVVLVVCIEHDLDINSLSVQYVLMVTIMTLLIQELILDIYRVMY